MAGLGLLPGAWGAPFKGNAEKAKVFFGPVTHLNFGYLKLYECVNKWLVKEKLTWNHIIIGVRLAVT